MSRPATTAKARRRLRTKKIALGLSVFAVYKDGRPRSIEIRNVPQVERAISRRVLVALLRAMNAAERLTSLMHLFTLAAEHAPEGSFAQSRDITTLMLLTVGTLHEATNALRLLRAAGVGGMVEGRSVAWARLEAIRLRWASDPTLRDTRNALAFHLGSDDEYSEGLATFDTGRAAVVFESDGEGRIFEARFPIALNTLFAGARVEFESLGLFLKRVKDDTLVFTRGVQVLFCEVLAARGAKFSGQIWDPADPEG